MAVPSMSTVPYMCIALYNYGYSNKLFKKKIPFTISFSSPFAYEALLLNIQHFLKKQLAHIILPRCCELFSKTYCCAIK